MNTDGRRLQGLSEELGFAVDALEKVLRLGELLEDIGKHPYLPRRLALKGGTVINLCFGPPRRLSVDLDFNYVGALDRAEMQEERPEVERALETLAGARGYFVQRSADAHSGRKLYLGYQNAMGSGDRIEVDLNYLFRIPVDGAEQRAVWQPAGSRGLTVRSVGTAELWIGKIMALLDRGAPRDLFDAALLSSPSSAVLRSARFKSLFVALAGVLPQPLHRYGRDRLVRLSQRDLEDRLYPMLARGERPGRDALITAAWEVLEPLLALGSSDLEYSDRLNAGELRPELLFADDLATAELLGRHPALLWKAQNARRRRR